MSYSYSHSEKIIYNNSMNEINRRLKTGKKVIPHHHHPLYFFCTNSCLCIKLNQKYNHDQSQSDGCLCKPFSWFLLQTHLGISLKAFTDTTSTHKCTIVCVVKMMTCCCFFLSQYQFLFYCVQIRYCALTNISPAEVIGLFSVLFSLAGICVDTYVHDYVWLLMTSYLCQNSYPVS